MPIVLPAVCLGTRIGAARVITLLPQRTGKH